MTVRPKLFGEAWGEVWDVKISVNVFLYFLLRINEINAPRFRSANTLEFKLVEKVIYKFRIM
jgi:hypothetical protein